jgi:hypothetical protein
MRKRCDLEADIVQIGSLFYEIQFAGGVRLGKSGGFNKSVIRINRNLLAFYGTDTMNRSSVRL